MLRRTMQRFPGFTDRKVGKLSDGRAAYNPKNERSFDFWGDDNPHSILKESPE